MEWMGLVMTSVIETSHKMCKQYKKLRKINQAIDQEQWEIFCNENHPQETLNLLLGKRENLLNKLKKLLGGFEL